MCGDEYGGGPELAVDERRWLELAENARRVLGEESGTTLMELLTEATGRGATSTRALLEQRVDELERRIAALESTGAPVTRVRGRR